MRVFVAGGTGLVGARLVAQLHQRGDEAVVLSRNLAQARQKLGRGPEIVEGNPTQAGPWMDAINGCQGVVNLVGEGLFAKRWSGSFQQLLRDSRLQSTANLVAAIRQATDRPEVFVSGSAIGYYGFHGDEPLTEASPPGDDFLAQLCVDWENAARKVEDLGVRLAVVRTGVVLDRVGGALAQMLLPFRLFLFGGKTGSGQQWVSWVHHVDEVGILLLALDHEGARGPLNATAPHPVRNQELAKAIGAALHRPSFWPTPGFLLRLALGEVADLVTKGQRVLPQRVQELGYVFQFSDITTALQDILGKPAAQPAPEAVSPVAVCESSREER